MAGNSILSKFIDKTRVLERPLEFARQDCVDTRTNLAAELEAVIARELPGRAFKSIITQAIALPDCSGKGKTLFQMKQYENHKVTEQYRILANEIEQRLLNREAFLAGQLEFAPEIRDEHYSSLEELEPVAISQ
jgi:cellulose biosynthesis protein BcsQ